ncbi:MAG: MSMEG_0568 family radical SAM protein [Chloroflexota bacterium]
MAWQEIILDLQSLGARIETPVENRGRRGGAGPADSKAFILAGVAAMVPTLGEFVAQSPYAVVEEGDGYYLTHQGQKLMPIQFPLTPRFYELETKEGIPYWKIALLHGQDVLATTVVQRCVRWRRPGERCQFCGIEYSLERGSTIAVKTPEQLAEVAEAAVRLDGIKQLIMTTGTINYHDMGIHYLAKCSQAIKAAVAIDIQAQFEPPENLDDLELLCQAGVDSVGMHLESFDPSVRERVTPGKAQISIERYFEAFERAVAIFGRNQVSSYLIVGLGEDLASLIEGCRRLAQIGVYPFVVPLRPIMGTPLQDIPAPDPVLMGRIYRQVAAINKEYGLNWRNSKAGCARCGACSGLTAFE